MYHLCTTATYPAIYHKRKILDIRLNIKDFPSVGVTGFEPATTRPPDVYSNRTELRPDSFGKKEQNPSLWDCKYSIFFKNKHISAGFFSIFAEMKRFSRLLLTFSAALASACGGSSGPVLSDFTTEIYTPAYASGFDIRGNGNNASTLVSIRNPWQGGTNVEQHLLILRDDAKAPADFAGQVVKAPVRHVVCMSSSHVAMFDAIGQAKRISGVSGIDYISNPYVREHRLCGEVRDVGYDTNLNFELLAAMRPDLMLLYGVTGENTIVTGKLRELGIPYIYIGDYMEESPLGKAEWLVAVAEIAGMRERGEEVFREIPLRYDSLKTLAAKAEQKPVVMLNTPYGDSWLMAPPSSYVARLIADAGGQYVYTQDTGNQSRPIDTEEAYRLAEMSDCWINVGSAASLRELAEIVPKFMDTRPVREGRVYNNNRRTNPSGGNDYWESGVIHPDLILQDLIRIFHPELTDAEPTYYRKLN